MYDPSPNSNKMTGRHEHRPAPKPCSGEGWANLLETETFDPCDTPLNLRPRREVIGTAQMELQKWPILELLLGIWQPGLML
jgi:hypothetical protein